MAPAGWQLQLEYMCRNVKLTSGLCRKVVCNTCNKLTGDDWSLRRELLRSHGRSERGYMMFSDIWIQTHVGVVLVPNCNQVVLMPEPNHRNHMWILWQQPLPLFCHCMSRHFVLQVVNNVSMQLLSCEDLLIHAACGSYALPPAKAEFKWGTSESFNYHCVPLSPKKIVCWTILKWD